MNLRPYVLCATLLVASGCVVAKKTNQGGTTGSTSGTTGSTTGSTTGDQPLCHDVDGDGVAADCAPLDCDDSNPAVWQQLSGYFDFDGDGVRAPSLRDACVGEALDHELVGDDCDDSNASVYQTSSLYIDHDGDGHTAGTPLTPCIGATAPAEFSETPSVVLDCDDSDGTVFDGGDLFVDSDHDGYTVGTGVSSCRGATLPDGFQTAASAIPDCDDSIGTVWERLNAYADSDGDGHRSVDFVDACMGVEADNVRAVGDDHCDSDTDNWTVSGCANCGLDDDGDGSVAACDRYSAHEGPDCDDADPLFGSNALDVPGDGVDQDCTGGDRAPSDAIAYFVDASATGGNGSRAAPFGTLQEGLDAAASHASRKLVLVQENLSYPGTAYAISVPVIGGYSPSWDLDDAHETALTTSTTVTLSGGGQLRHLAVQSTAATTLTVITEASDRIVLERVFTTTDASAPVLIGAELQGQGEVVMQDSNLSALPDTAGGTASSQAIGLHVSGSAVLRSRRNHIVGVATDQVASAFGAIVDDTVTLRSQQDVFDGGTGSSETVAVWLRGQARLFAVASQLHGVGRLGFATFTSGLKASDQSEYRVQRSVLSSGIGHNGDSNSRACAARLQSTGAMQELVGNRIYGGTLGAAGSSGYATCGVVIEARPEPAPAPIVAFNTIHAGAGDALQIGVEVSSTALIENNLILASGPGSTAVIDHAETGEVLDFGYNDLYGAAIACLLGSTALTCTTNDPVALTNGNFSADPQIDASDLLSGTSPCIDAARAPTGDYAVPVDMAGGARPAGPSFDIGADEHP